MSRVLVACEFSGIVRDAFRARGHDAWSCDLLPTETKDQRWHIKGDIFRVLDQSERMGWLYDLMIAHPPCTYLANSGVRWLKGNRERWQDMVRAANFFKALLERDIPRIAAENPIMHKYAVEIIGRRQDQVIQPWMFGHPEQKATCLWLKNLPKLEPTNNVKDQMEGMTPAERQRLHWTPPGPDRWKIRSTTFQGIANAMADQWGALL